MDIIDRKMKNDNFYFIVRILIYEKKIKYVIWDGIVWIR